MNYPSCSAASRCLDALDLEGTSVMRASLHELPLPSIHTSIQQRQNFDWIFCTI
jgi:hypothetical protein